MSLLLCFISPVQLRRGVMEWLWWAPGVQPGSTPPQLHNAYSYRKCGSVYASQNRGRSIKCLFYINARAYCKQFSFKGSLLIQAERSRGSHVILGMTFLCKPCCLVNLNIYRATKTSMAFLPWSERLTNIRWLFDPQQERTDSRAISVIKNYILF